METQENGRSFYQFLYRIYIEITEVYMENLDQRVTEQDLVSTFNSIGTALVAVQIFHRSLAANGRSFCYAFLTLSSYDDAMKALYLLDRIQVKGRHIRMMLSHRVTCLAVNLAVDGTDHSIDNEKLRNLFCAYANIVSCRVTVKGSGYVQFDSEDSAMAALIRLHETIMQGKKLYASNFPRRLRTYVGTNNLHVKSLDLFVNDTTLKDYFSCCGGWSHLWSCEIKNGTSKGYGFFCFRTNKEAWRPCVLYMGGLYGFIPPGLDPCILLSPAIQGLQKDHLVYLQFFKHSDYLRREAFVHVFRQTHVKLWESGSSKR